MAEWFEVRVRFLRQMDNGLIKQVAEQYLIDSLSFTEAEGRVMLEVGEGMREVTVQKIARSNIKEVVFYGDTDMWYRCKVQYSTAEEETEKEKKVTTYLLVNANDAKEAFERTEVHLKDMLVPFSIPEVKETKIAEVYQHIAGLRPGLRRMEKQPEAATESKTENPSGNTPHPLWKLLSDLGVTLLQSEQDEIEHMHESCGMVEFIEYLQEQHGMNAVDAAVVWRFLEDGGNQVGSSHEWDVPDESNRVINEIGSWWGFEIDKSQVQRIVDQCRNLPENEFRTWFQAAHNATPWQVSRVIEICAANS